MKQQDMLEQNNNTFKLSSLLIILILNACLSVEEQNSKFWKEYYLEKSKPEYKALDARIREISQNIIGKEEYWKLYNSAKIALTMYSKSKSKDYDYLNYTPWQIDSTFCVNSSGDKAIFAYSIVDFVPFYLYNDHSRFLAAKIKNKWYFLGGESQPILKDSNLKNIDSVFKYLHTENLDQFLKGYLKQIKNSQEWEINSNFFSVFTDKGWHKVDDNGIFIPKTKEDFDKRYLEVLEFSLSVKNTSDWVKGRYNDSLIYEIEKKEIEKLKNKKWYDGFF